MVDVFISYARVDRPRVELLAQALEGAGYSVWWDHDIAGGAAFAAEIERALNDASSVGVAWSVNAIQSDWVIDEATIAKQAGKLVPIQLDATPPPLGFRQYQVVDFSGWRGPGINGRSRCWHRASPDSCVAGGQRRPSSQRCTARLLAQMRSPSYPSRT
jgi:hypothetical protein